MPITAEAYERVALEDGDEKWELARGYLRKKPPMITEHNAVCRDLMRELVRQLDTNAYTISTDPSRARIFTGSFYAPDLCLIPCSYKRRLRERPGAFEVYEDPLPLIVEVWSSRTGEDDVESKLREYQGRGDAEIWRIHPYERTLTTWRRQPNGTYTETVYTRGTITLMAVPGVRIDIARLFA